MTRSESERIGDILDACRKLSDVAQRGRAEFDENWVLQSAAERQLEIIGEAVVHLSDDFLASLDAPARQARGLRNVLSHEYFRINQDRVWNVVVNDVPVLFAALAPYAAEPADG